MSKILIFGLQKSGKALFNLLKDKSDVVLYDDNLDIVDDRWTEGKLINMLAVKESIHTFDLIIYSPSIPQNNWLLVLADEKNIPILNEFEFCFNRCKAKTICVTGTDGKTTTAYIMDSILKCSGIKHKLAGNVGIPFSTCCDDLNTEDIAVLEVSSFMLTGSHLKPDIAIVTNITADHLDWHKDFKEYIKAKANITKHQTEKDILILNADDEISSFLCWQTNAKTYFFSNQKKVNGCYSSGNALWLNLEGNAQKLIDTKELKIKGNHNKANAMTAALACYFAGVKVSAIKTGLKNFCGVPHRLEFVDKIGKISYINDSKATTPHAVIAAIKTYNNVSLGLILGGSDKNLSFDDIFKAGGVRYYAFTGQTTSALILSAQKNGIKNYFVCKNLKECVETLSLKLKKRESVVLLSPACASFDAYKNFVERGNAFKDIVSTRKKVKEIICERK